MGFDDAAEDVGIDSAPDPMAELEDMDAAVEAAGEDEMDTMFDSETMPRDHRKDDPDEPVADADGVTVDMMVDTEPIENELGADLEVDDRNFNGY